MKNLALLLFSAALCMQILSPVASDIEDLSLNYNQIKQLISSFSSKNLVKAVNFAIQSTEMCKTLENRIAQKAPIVNGTISQALLIESLPDENSKLVDSVAGDMLKASSYLLNMYCKNTAISNKDCVKFMSKYTIPESTNLATRCQETNSIYKGYRRMLHATYQDSLQRVRTDISNRELPLPRVISNVLFTSSVNSLKKKSSIKHESAEGVLDSKLSLSVAQWTQFIEHDLSKTVVRSMSNGSPIECCDQESVPIQPRYLHPACQPLVIPSDDPHYKDFRVTCLNYVRSALAINEHCKFGGINQLNQATNKLDLSQLYGYGGEAQRNLRSLYQGLLLTSTEDSTLLPKTFDELCLMANENSTCFMSGDSRVNANPFVTIMYTMFLRSHNQIARKLLRMNPKWNDNQLFGVTKAINIAIYQKFIYNDWANAVLGKRLALEIRSKNNDHDGKKYKSDKVSNEFGSAAIRFYNTMLPGDLLSHQDDPNRILSQSTENIIEAVGTVNTKRRKLLKLQDSFYRPHNLNKDHLLDQLTNAILWQNSMAMDNSYVDDLSMQLFRSRMFNNKVFGGDQLAFDIQRTRDHGLQPYINYIKKCLNIRITRWDDLTSLIAEVDLNKLRSIYTSVQDVDLIVGALSEIPNENATTGPTISCILSDQLISSRISDDNFYNRRNDEIGEKIAKTVEMYSAARFICDNTKLKKVQRNIFLVPSPDNAMIDCSDYEKLPKLDLSYWLVIQPQS